MCQRSMLHLRTADAGTRQKISAAQQLRQLSGGDNRRAENVGAMPAFDPILPLGARAGRAASRSLAGSETDFVFIARDLRSRHLQRRAKGPYVRHGCSGRSATPSVSTPASHTAWSFSTELPLTPMAPII